MTSDPFSAVYGVYTGVVFGFLAPRYMLIRYLREDRYAAAAYAAAAGMKCEVFIPKDAKQPFIDECRLYGANVTLVDVATTPIEALTETGVKVGGREHAVDALVFATGFDAMTGTLNRIDISGRGGARLKDKWQDGPRKIGRAHV